MFTVLLKVKCDILHVFIYNFEGYECNFNLIVKTYCWEICYCICNSLWTIFVSATVFAIPYEQYLSVIHLIIETTCENV